MKNPGKLAKDGGKPVRTAPWPARIQIGNPEIKAVTAMLERCRDHGGAFDRYGGVEVDAYEKEFAKAYGCRFATSASSGTAAIHAALGALQLDAGSEVITNSITDTGAVAPIIWNNCIPVFADHDPETFQISPASVESLITDKTRAIICAHIAGCPCDLDAICRIGKKAGIPVIEDCAQAHGARWAGRPVGSIGVMGAFSLMSGKHTTAGGQGGMVTTNDEALYWNAKRFADRGKPFNSDAGSNLFLGLNYRMTELEAAIGRVQLARTQKIADARRKVVAGIEERIADLKAVSVVKRYRKAEPSYWFLLIAVDESRLKVTKADFAAAMRAEGIPCGADYNAVVYKQRWITERRVYGNTGCPWDCPLYGRRISYENINPGVDEAVKRHMMISVHECMKSRESRDIAAALRKVEAAYLR